MKRIVLLSGGVDSTTCLAMAKADGAEVIAVCVFYGQRHSKEIKAAKAVADYYGVKMRSLNLAEAFDGSDCPLLSQSVKSIPHDSYSEQASGGGPVSTYVPFRNGLMLSAAASIALSIGASEVWYGAHADDAAGSAYPDCSIEFVEKMNAAVKEGTANMVSIVAPLVRMNKAGVVREGLRLGAPYELTWSCYEGGNKPCGKCATCIDRAIAFKENGVPDPALEGMR